MLTAKEDMEMIEEKVMSLQQGKDDTRIIHIAILEEDYALAFYESDIIPHMGVMELKKGLFDWEFQQSVSERIRDNPQFTQLTNYSAIYGRVKHDTKEIEVELQNGETFPLETVQGEAKSTYWIFYSNEKDLSGAKVTRVNRDGEIEEIQVPDEPNKGLNRTIE
jgi:hypothetical protein